MFGVTLSDLDKAWGPVMIKVAATVAIGRATKIPHLLLGWMDVLKDICLETAEYEYTRKGNGDMASATDVRTTGIMIVFEFSLDNQDAQTQSDIFVRLYPDSMVLTVGDQSANYLTVKGDMWKQMDTGMIASKIVEVFEKHLGWNARPF